MKFSEYLSEAWNVHTLEPEKLRDEFKTNFKLLETEKDSIAMARLIAHVCGEHLGDWEKGIELLRKLKNNSLVKDKSEINRLVAVLSLGNFPTTTIDEFSLSDQAMIYIQTAQALSNLGGIKTAEKFFHEAISIAETKLPEKDSAFLIMAMSCNNIAVNLEKKSDLNEKEKNLMIAAAKHALAFFTKTSTWMEIERAHYRLAKSYIRNKDFNSAGDHAKKCLEIVEQNGSIPLELFFAYEIQAIIAKESNNQSGLERTLELMKGTYDLLAHHDQEWCASVLISLGVNDE